MVSSELSGIYLVVHIVPWMMLVSFTFLFLELAHMLGIVSAGVCFLTSCVIKQYAIWLHHTYQHLIMLIKCLST